jgi:hypothetical protein
MKQLKLTTLTMMVGLAVLQSYADTTNVVQNLSIRLFGVTQGGSFSNSSVAVTRADFVLVDTKRVIGVLGAATGNSFSPASTLVVVTPLGGGSSSIQVRDGANAVDVTSFFAHQVLSGTVESSLTSLRFHRSLTTDYSIQQFALQDGNGSALTLHFNVSGFTTESSPNGGQSSSLVISAAGSGDQNGKLMILEGSVSVRGGTLEVVSGGGSDGSGGPQS